MGRQAVSTMVNVVSSQTTMPALDIGFAFPMTSSGEKCREVIQLCYNNNTNDTASIPAYFLLNSASGPGPEADGSYNITTHDVFMMVAGPTGMTAGTQGVNLLCWPSHAKTNLAGRFIIPPGWRLVVSALDANMDGTVNHLCITQECA